MIFVGLFFRLRECMDFIEGFDIKICRGRLELMHVLKC